MSFVCSAAFTSLVLELFAAQLGERIIDFGCRSGEVTLEIKKKLVEQDPGDVFGVGYSESMVCCMLANVK